MDTMIRRTRTELHKAITELRDAGGTTTQMLNTIARMLTWPAASPADAENHLANVLDTASCYYADLSGEYEINTGSTPYPPETTFDDLVGDDQTTVITHVINEFGDMDEPDLALDPLAFLNYLLGGLRQAAALKVEYGDTYAAVHGSLYTTLVLALRQQHIDVTLAIEAIGHALETGKGMGEAIAYMNGQL
ncbi:hypothetical protein [Microbispora bryophytorum]|uniref:hypothetical protein n=1 Tax=Microbispora bryophytorum TaxID=1460882 RepID=UPI0033F89919